MICRIQLDGTWARASPKLFGDQDRHVDSDHAHRLILMLFTRGKEYAEVVVPGGVHSFDRDQWISVLPAVRRFLTKHLFPGEYFIKDQTRRE